MEKSNNNNKKLSDKSARQIIDDLDTLSKDPALQQVETPAREDLATAMRKARELYDKRATANEWGEVAQTVGQALARAFAAREGLRSNQNMSNLDMGPGFDFQGRGNRLFREYQQEVSDAQDLDKLDRERSQEQQQIRRGQYGKESDVLGTALRYARDKEENRDRESREGARESRDADRASETNRRLQLQDLRQQEQDLKKQLQARQQLANELTREKDISSKAGKKLQEKYGSLAAQGDLDLAGLQSELAATDKPGMLWDSPDPEARRATLGNKVQEIKQMLDQVRAQKQQLLQSLPEGKATAAPAPSTPSSPKGMVKMRAPDGTIGLIPEAQVEAALQAGATRVE